MVEILDDVKGCFVDYVSSYGEFVAALVSVVLTVGVSWSLVRFLIRGSDG